MSYPAEYVLLCGYFPDLFARNGLPPDVLFEHVRVSDSFAADCEADAGLGAARHKYALILQDAAEDIVQAIKEKYRLDTGSSFSRPFLWDDCFWSVEAAPVREYIGADADYPVNPC